VVKAWAVKRSVEGERWDIGMINGVRGTPAEPIPGRGRIRVPIRVWIEVSEDVKFEEEGRQEVAPRRVKVTKKYLEKYGYTEGCEGCSRAHAGLGQRAHSEAWKDGGRNGNG
jgi:hypothetical protein